MAEIDAAIENEGFAAYLRPKFVVHYLLIESRVSRNE